MGGGVRARAGGLVGGWVGGHSCMHAHTQALCARAQPPHPHPDTPGYNRFNATRVSYWCYDREACSPAQQWEAQRFGSALKDCIQACMHACVHARGGGGEETGVEVELLRGGAHVGHAQRAALGDSLRGGLPHPPHHHNTSINTLLFHPRHPPDPLSAVVCTQYAVDKGFDIAVNLHVDDATGGGHWPALQQRVGVQGACMQGGASGGGSPAGGRERDARPPPPPRVCCVARGGAGGVAQHAGVRPLRAVQRHEVIGRGGRRGGTCDSRCWQGAGVCVQGQQLPPKPPNALLTPPTPPPQPHARAT